MAGRAAHIPTVADGRALDDAQARELLSRRIRSRGTAVVIQSAAVRTEGVDPRVSALIADGKLQDVPAEAAFLQGYAGPKPALKGLFGADGELRVLLLPVTGPGIPAAGSSNDPSAQVLALFLKHQAPAGFAARRFPIESGESDPFLARPLAVAELRRTTGLNRPPVGAGDPGVPATTERVAPPASATNAASPKAPPPGTAAGGSDNLLPPVREKKPKSDDESF